MMQTSQLVTRLRELLADVPNELHADGSLPHDFQVKLAFAELDRQLSHGAELPYQWNPRLRGDDETEVEIEYWRGR